MITNVLTKFLHREVTAYRRLASAPRDFLVSALIYDISDNLIFTYAYAYIFTQTHSVLAAAIFNLAFYPTLLIGFVLNGWLLRHLSSKQLLVIGAIGQSLAVVSLMFINQVTFEKVGLIGAIFGIPLGLYWGNRNLVYIHFTTDDNRHYFEGLRKSVVGLVNVTLPLIAGWFIASTSTVGLISSVLAYRLIGLFGLLLVLVAVWRLRHTIFPKIVVKRWRLISPSAHWKTFRWFVLISSVQFALVLSLPEVLILKYLGNEAVLGTMQSVFVIVTSVGLYLVGRLAGVNTRWKILGISAWPLIISAIILSLWFNPVTILLYLLVMVLSDQLFWFVYFPVLSKAVEHETGSQLDNQYAYIVDHEIFINLGRIIASIAFILIVYRLGDQRGILFVVMIGALTQLASWLVAKRLFRLQSAQ